MPPSIERTISPLPESESPTKNVTQAVNYEVSLVDEFVESSRTPARGDVAPSKSVRKSARGPSKRERTLAKSRVRYDMELVPPVSRSRSFLANPRNVPIFTEADSSVVWIPPTRRDWEDSIAEMTAVCTSAALRRPHQRPFRAPLSREYIRDRVDIDDPLLGYQIRHKQGGWLQGFIMYTNFTTWTHGFCWDSEHECSGMADANGNPHWDADGALAKELQSLDREGDPHVGGIIFPQVAEIGLVGGLGCGEYLLRMALDAIRATRRYKYVALQATDLAKTFYERFGFIRVGAVCRYSPDDNAPIVGYRHWTHANESDASLQMHGGPSYMMCLKLEDVSDDWEPSFLNTMMSIRVKQKPTIEQMGAAPSSSRRKDSFVGISRKDSFNPETGKRKPGRPRGSVSRRPTATIQSPLIARRLCLAEKRSNTDDDNSSRDRKRRRTSLTGLDKDHLLAPPLNGEQMSYAQKQYQSVWLAVPPLENKGPRHPPRERGSDGQPALHNARDACGRFVKEPASSENGERLLHAGLLSEPKKKHPPEDDVYPQQLDSRPPIEPSREFEDGERLEVSKLTKQKVKSYPRSRVHFYNKVVKRRDGSDGYFFVLHYNETLGTIRFAPLEQRGTLTGKREGRARFQAVVPEKAPSAMPVSEYQIVPSTMVMKTPVVSAEAWDIRDDPGSDTNNAQTV